MSWIYNSSSFIEASVDAFGFVYCITNLKTKQKYIGKKQFWSYLTKKISGKKNKKHFTKESDWKIYWSSCGELKEDVKIYGEENFLREILQIYATKGELTYGEVEYQIKRSVLTAKFESGLREYYNRNIMNRWFVRTEKT